MVGELETDEEVGGWVDQPSEITYIFIFRSFCICFKISLEMDNFCKIKGKVWKKKKHIFLYFRMFLLIRTHLGWLSIY